MNIRIENARIIDPAAGEDKVRPLFIRNGRIAQDGTDGARVIDASGLVAMAGGIDIHTHVVAPPLIHAARGAGLLYSAMGYTAVTDPSVFPDTALAAHRAAAGTPQIDKALLVILASEPQALGLIEKGDSARFCEYVSWIINATKSFSLKLVNPGGRYLKGDVHRFHGIDEPLDGFNVTPRAIITGAAGAVEKLSLPHPLHLHMNNLGLKGSCKAALDVMKALEGRRAHLAHLQFYCYGDGEEFSSAAARVAEAVNETPGVTFDMGAVVFQPTTIMTADERLARRLAAIRGHEPEEGVVYFTSPYHYRRESAVNSVQWAAGLELALLVSDPWKVILSTDHPNGGPFTAYPYIIRLLMDSAFRNEELSRIHPGARERSALKDISREYSLYEIAVITRAAPARALGLADKGTLAPGADADVVLYKESADFEEMFSRPPWVIKGGEIIVEEGRAVKTAQGKTFHAAPPLGRADISGVIGDFLASRPRGAHPLPLKPEDTPCAVEAPARK